MLLDSVEAIKVGNSAVTKIFAGTVEVWPRGLPVLSSTSTIWDKVVLTWTAPAVGASNYILKRDGTQIYSGTALTFTDTLLSQSTAYTYTLEAYKGAVKQSTATKAQTTVAHGALGLTYSQLSYNYVLLSWVDSTQGSIDQYQSYVNGVYQQTSTSAADKADGIGLAESTAYTGEIRAYRSGVEVLPRGTVAFSTPARPRANGTAYSNVSWESFTGYTASTPHNLGGNNIGVGVGGTFTNLVALVYGRGGVAFRGEPYINGVKGAQQVYTVGRSHTNWPFNLGFAAGTFTTSVLVGGTNWGTAEWSPWTGQVWNYYCQTNQLDYWYYTSRGTMMTMASDNEWMTPELADEMADQSQHMLSWSDESGMITKVQIGNPETGGLYVDWVDPTHIDHGDTATKPDWAEHLIRLSEGREHELPVMVDVTEGFQPTTPTY